jgi:molybdopterin-guanine dinucleotide biosynthesis protein A
MPLLNPGLLACMADYPRDYNVLLPDTDRPQPMHAIYAASCLPVIEKRIGDGRHRVTELLEHLGVRKIERDVVQRFDPEHRSWFNVNTPADFELARQVLGSTKNIPSSKITDN